MLQHREQIDKKVKGTPDWHKSEDGPRVLLERSDSPSGTASSEELENVRQWMADNLLQLRDAIQPYLDKIKAVEVAASNEDSGAG